MEAILPAWGGLPRPRCTSFVMEEQVLELLPEDRIPFRMPGDDIEGSHGLAACKITGPILPCPARLPQSRRL